MNISESNQIKYDELTKEYRDKNLAYRKDHPDPYKKGGKFALDSRLREIYAADPLAAESAIHIKIEEEKANTNKIPTN